MYIILFPEIESIDTTLTFTGDDLEETIEDIEIPVDNVVSSTRFINPGPLTLSADGMQVSPGTFTIIIDTTGKNLTLVAVGSQLCYEILDK